MLVLYISSSYTYSIEDMIQDNLILNFTKCNPSCCAKSRVN